MKRRINPNRVMLGMMPRACGECKHVQHVFFRSQEEYDKWDCPVCQERIEPDSDEPVEQLETESE